MSWVIPSSWPAVYMTLRLDIGLFCNCRMINVFAVTHLQRVSLPSNLLWNTGLNRIVAMELPRVVSCSCYHLGYSAEVFQALQLVILAVFEAMDEPLAPTLYVGPCSANLFQQILSVSSIEWTIFFKVNIYFDSKCRHLSRAWIF